MGRIRTQQIKRVSEEILSKYRDRFTKDFEKNKKILDSLTKTYSKQLRNRIAGYIVHVLKGGEK